MAVPRPVLRIEGTGEHHLTKVIDAKTGEDIGIKYGVTALRYEIGNERGFPQARLVLEIDAPVEIAIQPFERSASSHPDGESGIDPTGPDRSM